MTTQLPASFLPEKFRVLSGSVLKLIAIILMLIHAVWETIVLNRGSEKAKAIFHKFSLVVWFIWLIPYFVGMYIGMTS